MKKSDLKSGMKVVCSNGSELIVSLGTLYGDIIMDLSRDSYNKLLYYTDDLYNISSVYQEYNIDKVYKNKGENYIVNPEWELLWEREPEVEEITADEAMKRLEEQSGKKVKIIR